jgi:hypothetical protein
MTLTGKQLAQQPDGLWSRCRNWEQCAMNKQKSSPHQDYLDAKAIEAALEAQSLPPGPERTKALRKAEKLRNAADIYNYLFSGRPNN